MEGADILTGWKEIEHFLGLKRRAILANGFPVRRIGSRVFATGRELREYVERAQKAAPEMDAD